MRALVTGSGGFVGRWLCPLLVDNGHTVEGWYRSTLPVAEQGVRYVRIDVAHEREVRTAIERFCPDVIFHLAALTNVSACETDSGLAQRINRDATLNIYGSMPAHCRGVFASTCHVYGEPAYLPIDEQHPVVPNSVYGASKLEAENAILAAKHNVVIARAFHHTGPGQTPLYAVADWAHQVRTGQHVLRVGNLSLTRDYTDVRDVVRAYLLLANQGRPGEIYNVCSGIERSLESIAHALIAGRSISVSVSGSRHRARDVARLYGSADKLRALGWRPNVPFQQTLADMVGG